MSKYRGEIKSVQQRFILSRELFDSVSPEEVEATYADMVELDIAKPPYNEFDIFYPGWAQIATADDPDFFEKRSVLRLSDKGKTLLYPEDEPPDYGAVKLVFRYKNGEPVDDMLVMSPHNRHLLSFANLIAHAQGKTPSQVTAEWKTLKNDSYVESLRQTYRLLLVLLATKNVEKRTSENKLAKLGIGKNKMSYRYTTTLHIGQIDDNVGKEEGSHVKRRPHLRRGHIRRQRYGPKNELIKKIFINPIFVNADEGWIAERTAYNVRL